MISIGDESSRFVNDSSSNDAKNRFFKSEYDFFIPTNLRRIGSEFVINVRLPKPLKLSCLDSDV